MGSIVRARGQPTLPQLVGADCDGESDDARALRLDAEGHPGEHGVKADSRQQHQRVGVGVGPAGGGVRVVSVSVSRLRVAYGDERCRGVGRGRARVDRAAVGVATLGLVAQVAVESKASKVLKQLLIF